MDKKTVSILFNQTFNMFTSLNINTIFKRNLFVNIGDVIVIL